MLRPCGWELLQRIEMAIMVMLMVLAVMMKMTVMIVMTMMYLIMVTCGYGNDSIVSPKP